MFWKGVCFKEKEKVIGILCLENGNFLWDEIENLCDRIHDPPDFEPD